MKTQRTPWWYYLLALLLGLLAGTCLVMAGELFNLSLIGAPWFISAVLLVVGILVLFLSWQVHRYATTDPRKRRSTMDPDNAVYILVAAKALGIAGATLVGWYGGQILLSIPHSDAPFYSRAIFECATAAGVSLIDMIIGIIGEWFCQLPPTEGPEHPKMKEAERRRKLAETPNSMSADTHDGKVLRSKNNIGLH